LTKVLSQREIVEHLAETELTDSLINAFRGEDLQPAPGHQHNEHYIAPMSNADWKRSLVPAAESSYRRHRNLLRYHRLI